MGGRRRGDRPKLTTGRLAWLGATLYMALGWTALVTLPLVWGRLGPSRLALMLAGGVLYTAGAVVLLRRRPDPSPAVFGYHEVWHLLVVGGSLCHYALILLLVR